MLTKNAATAGLPCAVKRRSSTLGWVLSVALRTQRARVDTREFRAKIQEQRGVIDPCDDHHQRAGGPVSGSRYTLPAVEPNEESSAAPIQTSLQAILVLGRSVKIIANRTVIESRERRKSRDSNKTAGIGSMTPRYFVTAARSALSQSETKSKDPTPSNHTKAQKPRLKTGGGS